MNKVTSCYIHIPFCSSICSYCDFPKVLYQKKWIQSYLDSLEEEIKTYYKNDTLKTIYIGGGTPLALDGKELKHLLQILSKLKKEEKIEYTIEGNIENIEEEKVKLLKEYGVNRVSLGIETFDKKNLKELNRTSNFRLLKQKIKLLRKYNITNINLDIMYAIDNRIKPLKKDIKKVLKLKVPHISTYSLIIEPHTCMYQKKEYIKEEVDKKMYDLILRKLKKYHHYEISNFAYPGFESKHNLTYWENECYYGFGLGASSYLKNRYENTRSLTKYLKKDYDKKEEVITTPLKKEYEVILNLRLDKGISKKRYQEKYKSDIKKDFHLDTFIKEGILIEEEDNIFISPKYIYLQNEILVQILDKKEFV